MLHRHCFFECLILILGSPHQPRPQSKAGFSSEGGLAYWQYWPIWPFYRLYSISVNSVCSSQYDNLVVIVPEILANITHPYKQLKVTAQFSATRSHWYSRPAQGQRSWIRWRLFDLNWELDPSWWCILRQAVACNASVQITLLQVVGTDIDDVFRHLADVRHYCQASSGQDIHDILDRVNESLIRVSLWLCILNTLNSEYCFFRNCGLSNFDSPCIPYVYNFNYVLSAFV